MGFLAGPSLVQLVVEIVDFFINIGPLHCFIISVRCFIELLILCYFE